MCVIFFLCSCSVNSVMLLMRKLWSYYMWWWLNFLHLFLAEPLFMVTLTHKLLMSVPGQKVCCPEFQCPHGIFFLFFWTCKMMSQHEISKLSWADVTLSLTFTIPSCLGSQNAKNYTVCIVHAKKHKKKQSKKRIHQNLLKKTKCYQKLQHDGHTVRFPIQVKMLRGLVYTVKSSTQGPLTTLLLFFLGGGNCTVVIDVKSVSKLMHSSNSHVL